MDIIFRGTIIGTVSEREAKTVGNKDVTEFRVGGSRLRIAAWGEQAAKVPAVGGIVVVEGKVRDRSYKVNNEDRTTTEVVASSVEAIETADDMSLPF